MKTTILATVTWLVPASVLSAYTARRLRSGTRLAALGASLFPPSQLDPTLQSWGESRPCSSSPTTHTGTHTCKSKGPHYAHTCVDPDCGFRWAG